MSTIHVVLCTVQARGLTGASMPIPDSAIGAGNVDTVTSSGTSALASPSGQLGQFWSITAKGGDVYLKFGAGTPVAVTDEGWLVLAGTTREFAVSIASEKCAIKDAA